MPSRGAKSSFVPPNDYIHQFMKNATVVEDLNTNDTAEDSRNETEIDMGSGGKNKKLFFGILNSPIA